KITRPPFVRGRGIDLLFDKAATIAKEIGFNLKRAPRVGGGSDGNFTVAMGIPTLDGLGVDGDGAHTNHEYMLFSSIEPRTRLLQGLMEQLEERAQCDAAGMSRAIPIRARVRDDAPIG